MFSGSLVYILILLINNNVGQLEEQFLGEELYVCIGLSYLIQEFSRLSLILFEKLHLPESFLLRISLQISISIFVCIGLVSTTIYAYYTLVLGFSPNVEELVIFNSIFSTFTLMYISLYLSHQFLHTINTEKMEEEILIKGEIEEDYRRFSRGINPQLLFDSFDELIVLMHQSDEDAEMLIDHLAAVYRYVLSGKQRELVSADEELGVLKELLGLFNRLPYRDIRLEITEPIHSWVVPSTLLFIVEQIIRSTIVSPGLELPIRIEEEGGFILISYRAHEKITATLQLANLAEIQGSYGIYSGKELFVDEEGQWKIIGIPVLEGERVDSLMS